MNLQTQGIAVKLRQLKHEKEAMLLLANYKPRLCRTDDQAWEECANVEWAHAWLKAARR
jgi:hypothetical protein